MPQLEYNYYAPEVMDYLDFDMISHVSLFDTDAGQTLCELVFM